MKFIFARQLFWRFLFVFHFVSVAKRLRYTLGLAFWYVSFLCISRWQSIMAGFDRPSKVIEDPTFWSTSETKVNGCTSFDHSCLLSSPFAVPKFCIFLFLLCSCWRNPDKINNVDHLSQMEDSMRETLNQVRLHKVSIYSFLLWLKCWKTKVSKRVFSSSRFWYAASHLMSKTAKWIVVMLRIFTSIVHTWTSLIWTPCCGPEYINLAWDTWASPLLFTIKFELSGIPSSPIEISSFLSRQLRRKFHYIAITVLGILFSSSFLRVLYVWIF